MNDIQFFFLSVFLFVYTALFAQRWSGVAVLCGGADYYCHSVN